MQLFPLFLRQERFHISIFLVTLSNTKIRCERCERLMKRPIIPWKDTSRTIAIVSSTPLERVAPCDCTLNSELEGYKLESHWYALPGFGTEPQPENLFSYLLFLHACNDFQSSYITFDIFNNSTFFDTTERTNEK